MYRIRTLVRTTTRTVHRRRQPMCKTACKNRKWVVESRTLKNSVLTSNVVFLLKRTYICVFSHLTSLRKSFVLVLTNYSLPIFACCFDTLWRRICAMCALVHRCVCVSGTVLLISTWESGLVGDIAAGSKVQRGMCECHIQKYFPQYCFRAEELTPHELENSRGSFFLVKAVYVCTISALPRMHTKLPNPMTKRTNG